MRARGFSACTAAPDVRGLLQHLVDDLLRLAGDGRLVIIALVDGNCSQAQADLTSLGFPTVYLPAFVAAPGVGTMWCSTPLGRMLFGREHQCRDGEELAAGRRSLPKSFASRHERVPGRRQVRTCTLAAGSPASLAVRCHL